MAAAMATINHISELTNVQILIPANDEEVDDETEFENETADSVLCHDEDKVVEYMLEVEEAVKESRRGA